MNPGMLRLRNEDEHQTRLLYISSFQLGIAPSQGRIACRDKCIVRNRIVGVQTISEGKVEEVSRKLQFLLQMQKPGLVGIRTRDILITGEMPTKLMPMLRARLIVTFRR